MSVKVNPPPQVRIPQQFLQDAEVRSFFDQQRTILFQLWNRTGGNNDAVSGSTNVVIVGGDTVLDSSAFGALVVVSASTAPVQITLPAITSDAISNTVDVAIIDATFDTTVITAGSETIFGEASVLMDDQYLSLQYTIVSASEWMAT